MGKDTSTWRLAAWAGDAGVVAELTATITAGRKGAQPVTYRVRSGDVEVEISASDAKILIAARAAAR